MSVDVLVCVVLCTWVSVYMFVDVCLWMCICVYVHVFVSVYVSVCACVETGAWSSHRVSGELRWNPCLSGKLILLSGLPFPNSPN